MTQRFPFALRNLAPGRILPFLEWLPGYRTRNLRADLFAGLTVALYYTHWPTLIMGGFAFAVMVILKKGGREKSCPLTSVRTLVTISKPKGV